MKKKKMILDIVGKAIDKHGFVYNQDKVYSGSGFWGFVRDIDSIKQRIFIQKNDFAESLYLNFATSAWGHSLARAGTHSEIKLPQGEYSNVYDEWYYETEEDFKKILVEFVDIIEKYGIDKLNEMSIEPEVIPTLEMAKKLLSSHTGLNENFIKNNKLNTDEVSKESVCKWFEVIERKFTNTKDEPYENVKDMLVEVAAFLGEQLRKEMGGEWKQRGQNIRNMSIHGLNTPRYRIYTILASVVNMWNNQDFDYTREYYLFLLYNKLPMTNEKMLESDDRLTEIRALKKKSC